MRESRDDSRRVRAAVRGDHASGRRRLGSALFAAALAVLSVPPLAPQPALAGPVKCSEEDITPGNRVFPEPRQSATFLRFDEFECAVRFLESQHPSLIEVTTRGRSLGGYPVYDVLLTDETISRQIGRAHV